MFERLCSTQPEIARQLAELVANDEFPSSSLFFGEQYSGRMFAAMSVGKEMNVPRENIVIVSDRNHFFRIKAATALLRKARNKASRDFLKENVSILLQQYHGALMDEQSATTKKRFADAAEVSELMERLDGCADNELDSIVSSVEKFVLSLADSNRTQAITVGQVRAIRDWCSTSSMDGERKLVVVEGLENALGAAVNAFLKTLEEPPANTYFILVSANPGRILATILSRVRKFRFQPLSKDDTRHIFNSLFVDPNRYEDLEQFFLEGGGIDDAKLKSMARDLVVSRKPDIPRIVAELEACKGHDIFFSHVVDELYRGRLDGSIDKRKADYLVQGINEMVSKARLFNQNKRLTLDYVLYRTKEVLG